MDKNYQNLVFTNHAFDRIKSRVVTQDAVWQTVNHPGKKFNQGQGSTKFMRTVSDRQVQVIATWLKPEQKWLIISVWVRGETDRLPLAWQIMILPFRIIWWLIKLVL